jgi:hypothetical protein
MAEKIDLLGMFKHKKRVYSAVFNFKITPYVWGNPRGDPIRYIEPTVFVKL